MGQDDSCGICGKHYQSCKHYLKSHVQKLGTNELYCGRSRRKGLGFNLGLVTESENEYDCGAIDPDDFCIDCQKAIGRPPGTISDENMDFLTHDTE